MKFIKKLNESLDRDENGKVIPVEIPDAEIEKEVKLLANLFFNDKFLEVMEALLGQDGLNVFDDVMSSASLVVYPSSKYDPGSDEIIFSDNYGLELGNILKDGYLFNILLFIESEWLLGEGIGSELFDDIFEEMSNQKEPSLQWWECANSEERLHDCLAHFFAENTLAKLEDCIIDNFSFSEPHSGWPSRFKDAWDYINAFIEMYVYEYGYDFDNVDYRR